MSPHKSSNVLFRSGQLVAGLFAVILYSFPGSFLLQLLCSDIQTSSSQTSPAGFKSFLLLYFIFVFTSDGAGTTLKLMVLFPSSPADH